jgi:hypothetical protein
MREQPTPSTGPARALDEDELRASTSGTDREDSRLFEVENDGCINPIWLVLHRRVS